MSRFLEKTLDSCKAPDDGVILLSEKSTSSYGYAFISHFIAQNLKKNNNVCFLSISNTWGHYCNVLSKFGMNVKNHTELNNLKVIEGLKLMSKIDDLNMFNFLNNCELTPLKDIFFEIKEIISKWKESNGSCTLIIDNLSVFLNLGVQLTEIIMFLQYCICLLNVNLCDTTQKNSIVLLVNEEEADEDSHKLLEFIKNKSNLYLKIKELDTGFSKQIHGTVDINCYEPYDPSTNSQPVMDCFQFKMEEKDIHLFAPGNASCVL